MAKRKRKKTKKKRRKLKKKKGKKSKKKLKRKKTKRTKKTRKSKITQSSELIFKVPKKWSNNAYVDKKLYEKKYKLSIKDNEGFWRKEGKRIDWIKPYQK